MAEKRLGARISLADRMTSPMMKIVGAITRTQSVAQKLNQSTQKMGQTMSSAANQAASGMSRMSTAANTTANSATKVGNAAKKATDAAERSGSAAERAAQKWKRLGDQYGTTSKQATMMMSNLDRASGAIQKAGVSVTTVGAGIGAGLGAAVNTTMNFESAMSRVGALSGANAEELDRMTKKAKELGSTTSFTATQASEGMQYLAMAGFDVNNTISAMPGLLSVAAAGQLDLGKTADIVSNVLSGYGMKAEETMRMADVMTATFTSSNTTLETLGNSFKHLGPVAASLSQDFEGMSAALGMLGNAGDQMEAGAHLRHVLIGFATPSKIAQKTMNQMGIELETFDKKTGKLKQFPELLTELQEKTKKLNVQDKLKLLNKLFGYDGATAVQSLINQGGADALKAYQEKLQQSAGRANEIAAKQLDNLKGSITILKSGIEGAAIGIGDTIAPAIRRVADGLSILVSKFNELNPVSKGIIATFAVMASVILLITGPVLLFLALLPAISGGLSNIASLFGVTRAALLGMLGPALLIIGAITAITIAFAILYSKSETFRNFVDGLFNSISKTVNAAIKQITDLAKGLWGYILVWWKQDGEKIRNAAHKIIDPLKKMWNGLSDAAKPAFEEMKNVVFYVWTAIEDNFYSGLDIILGAISILSDVINGDFSGAWNTLKETIDKVVNRFTSAQWVTDLKDAFVSFKNDAVDYVNDAIETLTTTYEKHQGAIKTTATILSVIFGPSLILAGVRATVAGAQITAGFIAAVVKAGYEAMIAGAKIAGEFVLSLLKSGWAAVVTAAKLTGWLVIALGRVALQATITAGALAGKLVVSLFQAARAGWAFNIALLANPMTWVVIGIIALIAAIVLLVKNWDTVKAKVLEVWESIKTKTSEAITAIKTTISEWINTAIQVGKDFLSGVATGFINGIDTVVSAAKSVWERIKSVFTGEPITVSPNVQYNQPAGPPLPPGYRAYASGGLIDRPHLGLVGEAGPEMIVPLSASRRGRGLELWQQAGQMLGAIPYANGGLVGARNVPERQKPSKPPSGMRGAGGKGNGGRGAGPTQNIFNISITGDQVAAMGEDKGYMRKVAKEIAEELLEELIEAADNYTIDNLGTMME